MPWRGPEVPGEYPTLGFQVIDWIQAYLVHGPGDVQGEPILLDDELARFVLRCYRLDPETGRRVYHEALLSRPKGRAKSELAGMLACAEAKGPVRFDGWDAAGEPVGRPVTYPFVRALVEASGASLVLDPFMGTGTTLRAAKDLGRCAIGIEVEERWCAEAARRLGQGVLDLAGAV